MRPRRGSEDFHDEEAGLVAGWAHPAPAAPLRCAHLACAHMYQSEVSVQVCVQEAHLAAALPADAAHVHAAPLHMQAHLLGVCGVLQQSIVQRVDYHSNTITRICSSVSGAATS